MEFADKNIKKNLNSIKNEIIEEFKNLDRKFIEIIAKQKEKINRYIILRVQEIILQFILKKTRPIIKKQLKDPDMCDFVKRIVDDLVDEIYPEIIEEIQFKLKFF